MSEETMDTVERIRGLAGEIEPEIIEARRCFHAYPERSTLEYETSAAICAALDKMGIPYRCVCETGVVASIKGTAAAPEGEKPRCVALRADIDALPVTEQTGAEYASKYEGVMHACGHDCHIAMLLGAARLVNEVRDAFAGEVRLLFQPAEECSIGAKRMIAAGALDGVDNIYGAHIWSELPAGMISCEPGQRMGHTDWFRIDVQGVSAHGSMPHKGVDAIVVAAELVNVLQILVSRDVSPFQPVVVTVGEFHGGEARNVMAGSAYLTGTVRTWSQRVRSEMPARMERIVERAANALGAKARLTYEEGNDGLANDPVCAERARKSVVEMLGEEAVASYDGTMSGEDFSEYLHLIPGVFVFVGCRNEDCGAVHPQHSCYFTVDESVLVKGAMVAARYAVRYLSE